MKDSRKARRLASTFIIGGASVVLLEYALRPTIEKSLKAKGKLR